MRCSAQVLDKSLEMRSGWSNRDKTCIRQAITEVNGRPLCLQHTRTRGYCQGRKTWFYRVGEGWICSCCRGKVRNVVCDIL